MMLKTKVVLLAGLMILSSGCSLFSKKKNKVKEQEVELIAEDFGDNEATEPAVVDSLDSTINIDDIETQDIDVDSLEVVGEIEIDDEYNQFEEAYTTDQTMEDKVDTYSEVIGSFQDEITKLQSELDLVTDELYQLKAKSQIWENPFSIYNKEIILLPTT